MRLTPSTAAVALAGAVALVATAVPAQAAPATVDLQLLGINDFHGRLQSPATVNGQAVGGAAQLIGLVDQLRATNPNTAFISAGDNIGASTFVSAINDDNPTLDVLNAGGLAVSAVGNHEFDKGMTDLLGRVIPRSQFDYLGANVYSGGVRALPAYSVQELGGVRVGYIGVVTVQTAELVSPDGIRDVEFRDPVAEANTVAAELSDGDEGNGEADVVVLITHEGAAAANIRSADDLAADPVFGGFMRAGADIDAIFSGHTHQPYAFVAPIPGTNRTRPVIQGGDYGKLISKVTLTVDTATGDVTASTAALVDVVGAPSNGTVAGIVDAAVANAAVLGAQPLGKITADVKRAYTDGNENRGLESPLGNFIADVQLEGTKDAGRGGAQIAFMNPGGLRTDLLYAPDGVVTYSEAFAVQPFSNDVITQTLTGAQIKAVLEEQWQPEGASRPKLHLGVSKGFSYRYVVDAPRGAHITSITLDGKPINPAGTYRVTSNSFLAAGGDNFTTLSKGTDRVTTGDNDLTLLTAYLAKHSPVTADPAPRATTGPACTESVTGTHRGALTVRSGLVCVTGATVKGAITVLPGASLIVDGGTVQGAITALLGGTVEIDDATVTGAISLIGSTGAVTVTDGTIKGAVSVLAGRGGVTLDTNTVTGAALLSGNTGTAVNTVAANTVTGALACTGNTPAPVNDGRPNTVRGLALGQCAGR
ncbi:MULTISPECIES: bifunctional metallophosphatase/5'-nucleotidase [Catenuloplanes]|uniref:5'-nucleotidase n=1 Tax=Catenuloplanes niger TaxID=587534 RepID=A0AAE3ZT03_9ACTN|nr:bifunctional UDP-sugar hydrolase/5'-nucleotidase [Catenuloplanes niger]MDR7324452.1 5'-nucleotidase [Catenuloplanes niger]